MLAATHVAAPPAPSHVPTYDALVIGAGISGMFMLYRLRELGMTARVFEACTDVGGTWYWNRYPGARFDSESWTLRLFVFQRTAGKNGTGREYFSPQPDTLAYLHYVADKFDLRRDIRVQQDRDSRAVGRCGTATGQ